MTFLDVLDYVAFLIVGAYLSYRFAVLVNVCAKPKNRRTGSRFVINGRQRIIRRVK